MLGIILDHLLKETKLTRMANSLKIRHIENTMFDLRSRAVKKVLPARTLSGRRSKAERKRNRLNAIDNSQDSTSKKAKASIPHGLTPTRKTTFNVPTVCPEVSLSTDVIATEVIGDKTSHNSS